VRIAVVCRDPVRSEISAVNGFDGRYNAIVRALSLSHELVLVHLASIDALETPATDLTDVFSSVHVVPAKMRYERKERIARGFRLWLGRPGYEPWESKLRETIAGLNVDRVVIFAWELRHFFRAALIGESPIMFVEENVRVLPGRRPERAAGVALAHFEVAAERHALRRIGVAVAINSIEEKWASTMYRRPTAVIPLSIDLEYWSASSIDEIPGREDGRERVLVAGSMRDSRNASGLRDVLECTLQAGLGTARLEVASSTGLHPMLDEHAPWFDFLGNVDDLRPLYRSASAALVPAFEVSGTKTTILQAWAMGCPVVTTAAGAASVGATDGVEVLIGRSAAELCVRIQEIIRTPDLVSSLKAAGHARLKARHGFDTISAEVSKLVRGGPA
jgi:glycosyltransferase involved in cell wall biosynthesis